MAISEVRDSHFRRTLTRAIALPALLLLALLGIFLWLLSAMLSATQWIDHTDQVLAQAHEVQSLMLDQQNSLRGYLLTDSDVFLAPYRQAGAQTDAAFDELRSLIADNPDQIARFDKLREYSRAWRSFAQDVLARKGRGEGPPSVATLSRGQTLMTTFRAQMSSFVAIEEYLRAERTQMAQRTTQLTVIGSVVAGVLAGALVAWFIRRQLLVLSQRYEHALDNARQREDELRERTTELERTAAALEERNRELDQFAYVTSHDLRAPLRGIANLSQWIEEDLGDNATGEIRKQLALLRGRAHRMEGLIDGILQYSRVGRVQGAAELVDVDRLVREAVDLLSPPPGFAVTIDPGLPTVLAERVRLQQVFSNLIGNAIKHHGQPGEGRVRVSVSEDAAFYTFRVSDNGPGIAPQFHQRVFVIFQTLASRDKVEGSGLGLSLVKKIIEQAGGRIWIESREGAGTAFCFTWPRGQKPAAPARAGAQAERKVVV